MLSLQRKKLQNEDFDLEYTFLDYIVHLKRTALSPELQKSHRYVGMTREEGLQNGQSVREASCQYAK